MPGILYVVATPIGNLEDVSLRALRILREVSIVAAEDTRRTGRLLQHYSISTHTTSLHEHNEREKTPRLIERLSAGESIALVSDAGTPSISDPGQSLVAAARAAGIRVDAIPGPSAVMAAIAASGLPAAEFTFLGFAPAKASARTRWAEALRAERRLVVFFEAPHRLTATLVELGRVLGADRLIGIGRELTKVHEELVICPIQEAVVRFKEPKGELTLLLPPPMANGPANESFPGADVVRHEIGLLTNNKAHSRRSAIKIIAEKYGLKPNELYRRLEDGQD